ncbi:MAG: hypothetical protein HOM95_02245, partial [Halieaceae bacterium]|nr:hypothetical protein [Halieaceae bacterium]
LDGKAVSSDAIVIAPGFDNINDWELGSVFSRVLVGLEKFVQQRGWAFAVLVPADG